jgi:acyl transferase domain-containing protein/acyl carrier protein
MDATAICKLIQQHLATKLGVSPDAINPAERFRRLGVDSLGATAMLAHLGAQLGRALGPTLAWQFPTPRDLSRHLAGEATAVEIPAAARRRGTADEPIAIVGLACRLPGAPDPQAFWRLLHDGVDAIREVPRDRWDYDALFDADSAAPGKISARYGGFLDDVASFDAGFFGISPREAAHVDPQQRLMLELSWEALEDAGTPPPRLKDTRTGVFFGAMWMDYVRVPEAASEGIGQFTATGQDLSIVPARVSYTLGLLGPSVHVNTACSSSIVALHLARHSLLRGESNVALAGAVNLILSPESMITMSKFGAAAPDGRCKAFDAAANGYVRSEGGGVVVLKRLSDALADGDRVYCVIRGTAINNDGFSNGLTAPSPLAQEGVLRDAGADAGIPPADVQYVEAHGTGTMLGDPIEAGALGAVIGRAHPAERPLRIGSVKTNIGHLESAAGMAGLIKIALSMTHRELPASLHFHKPNPHIPFDDLHLRVQSKREPWPADDGRRIAGISSFGFGGTNAHAILESTEPARSIRLAAETETGLRDAARSLRHALQASSSAMDALPESPPGLHRLAVTVSSARELANHLDAFVGGTPQPGLLVGTKAETRPRIVLVFGGQGSQWLGMGRALLRDEPSARAVLEECDRVIRGFTSWSLIDRLRSDDPAFLDRTDYVQPALFSMQVALARALQARGVEVDAVVGQSMGEVAAAHVAGALSLTDAIRIMCTRSQLVGKAERGRMLVAGLSLDAASAAIAPFEGRLSVAVAAGPESTVVAGAEDAVLSLHADLERRGVAARIVRVDYASHSHYMDPLLAELEQRLAPTRPRSGPIAFWSTVSGQRVDGATLDAAYWTRNLREPVLFAPTVERLAKLGPTVFVEVDPHPVLALFVEQCIAHAGAVGAVVGCAARDEPEPLTLRETAGRLYVAGCEVAADSASDARRSAELVVLSARTPEAVRVAAGRLRKHVVDHPSVPLTDIAFSAMATRAAMESRLAFAVPDRDALLDALGAASADASADIPSVPRDAATPKLALVFPGQGSQWLGMGRGLLREEPVFAETLAACDRAIALETGWSVVAKLEASADPSALDRMDVVQPLLFALEVALAALWRSWGVEPDGVVGHSMGEVAAAHVIGALSLEDAAAIICRRSAMMQRLTGKGEMALVELSMDEAAAAIRGLEDRLGIAVSNSSRSTVLSGDPAAMAQVLSALEGRGVFCRRIKVDMAAHSPQLDPLLGDLRAQLDGVTPRAASMPMRSTVDGTAIQGPELTADYWIKNWRQPVRFADAIKTMLAEGFTLFVEVSPHPVLAQAIDTIRAEERAPGFAVGSLRRDQPERRTMLESLGMLHVHGLELDPTRLFAPTARRVPLPTYPWQRERHWLPPAPKKHTGGEATAHPLLGVRIAIAGAGAVYESRMAAGDPAFFADHRVGALTVVPGAALAEMLRAAAEDHAGGQDARLSGLVLQAPLIVPERGAVVVQVVVTSDGAQASVHSRASDAAPADGWTTHATCEVSVGPLRASEMVDVAAIRRRCTEVVSASEAYRRFAALGIGYGPAFQGLKALSRGPGEALAEVTLPPGLDADAYGIHPALLDAALQSVIAAAALDGAGVPLPFEIARFDVRRPGASSALVHVRLDTKATDGVAADVVLMTETGAVVAQVEGLRLRRGDISAARAARGALPDAFYRLDWTATDAPTATAPAASARWAVVSIGDREAAGRIADALRAAGSTTEVVTLDALRGTRAQHVVCAWEPRHDAEGALRAATEGLAIFRALADRKEATRLWWITRSAVAVQAGADVAAASAAVWGLGRTLMLERPELRCTLVDVGPDDDIGAVLAREIAADDDESQIAWRGTARSVARLARAAAPAVVPDAPNFRLVAKQRGTLEGLALVATPRRDPGPGEVEIEVAAAGLNFRDVLGALGMVDTGPIGTECAGVVTRLGSGVTRLAVGDRVMAIAAGSVARFAVTDARRAARVPKGISLEQAATIPAVFLTAQHALHHLAGLKRGERILIHAAAGGVGMAAIQVAQQIGAEVLATASPSKWDVVRSLGVKRVANSRDKTFVDAFGADKAGVDVVLNALVGDLVDASLSLMRPGGRFIEMGKTDLRDPAAVAAAHPGVTYRAFDLLESDPDHMAALFAAVVDAFESGHLRPLPTKELSLAEAEEGFRFMAQARHVGKLAFVFPRATLRLDGTAVITGGLGALGLEVARNFAKRGVKHLVLTGRRGASTPGAAEAVAELEALGARVTVAAVDIADRAALARVLDAIPPKLPLRAVIHAAVVLDDGVLSDQTPERFAKVMGPKVAGAWNLHALTSGADLDAFVLFSSVVGTLGNVSQGAYSAANACLDALAVHRRARGKPASSLAWGPWAEVGKAAGLKAQLQARWAAQGLGMIAPAIGMALFDKALDRREPQLVVVPIDLRAAAKSFGAAVPPVWRGLVRAAPARAAVKTESFASEIAALSGAQRTEAVAQIVRAEVARVLSLGRAAAVPLDRPLRDLGLDSLMAVELRNALGRRVGATLTANLAFDYPTPALIAAHLLTSVPSLSGGGAPPASAPAHPNGAVDSGIAKAVPVVEPSASKALVARPPAPAVEARAPKEADQITTIPMGERWLADGFRVIPTPAAFAQRAVDMTRATQALALLAQGGVRGTFTHLIVRAAALVLARNPKLHETIVGYRKIVPGSADIGLSMLGQTTYAPVVVLPAVERVPLRDLVGVVAEATATARAKEAVDLVNLRRIGWMTPFGFFRRFVIGLLQKSFWFRRRLVGTFQVTSVPTVDSVIPLQFYAGSILSSGRVQATAVAIDGRIEVRPMLTLTICSDHATVDASRAAAILHEIAQLLEGHELVEEARVPPVASTPMLTDGSHDAKRSDALLEAVPESKSA